MIETKKTKKKGGAPANHDSTVQVMSCWLKIFTPPEFILAGAMGMELPRGRTVLWRACNLIAFTHSSTGPVVHPFAHVRRDPGSIPRGGYF
jgi:hypothetical protein